MQRDKSLKDVEVSELLWSVIQNKELYSWAILVLVSSIVSNMHAFVSSSSNSKKNQNNRWYCALKKHSYSYQWGVRNDGGSI